MERNTGIIRDAKLLFAAAAVMLLFSSSVFVMPAYAYSTSVSNPESGIGCVYGCVDICTYTGSGTPATVEYSDGDFTTDRSISFDTSNVSITKKTNGRYSVTGTASVNGHYAVVTGGVTGLRLYASLAENGDGNLDNVAYTLRINDTVFDDSGDYIEVSCGTAYRIQIIADMSGVGTNLVNQPVLPTLSLEISVSADGGASTVTADRITLVYTSVDASNEIVELNQEEKDITKKEGDDNYSYTEADGNVYYIIPNEDRSDGHAAVYITNGDDSTDFSSSSNWGTTDERTTTLELPPNREFVIQVNLAGGFIISGGSLEVELTIGSTGTGGEMEYKTYTGEVKRNGTTYLYIKNVTNKNLATANNLSGVTWMSGDSVSVKLTGSSTSYLSDVTIGLQIVFN